MIQMATAGTRSASVMTVLRAGLTVLAVAGLGIDAYVHFDLAGNYAPIRTSTLSQADLFRAEAVVSILAALVIVVRARRYTAVIAALVSGSALFVLVLYRYCNVGKIGPLPNMYEPVWFTEKSLAAIGEGAAFVAAGLLAVLAERRHHVQDK